MNKIKNTLLNEKWIIYTFSILKTYIIIGMLSILTGTYSILKYSDKDEIIAIVLGAVITIVITCIVEAKGKYDNQQEKLVTLINMLTNHREKLINAIIEYSDISQTYERINKLYYIVNDIEKSLKYEINLMVLLDNEDINNYKFIIANLNSYQADLTAIRLSLENLDRTSQYVYVHGTYIEFKAGVLIAALNNLIISLITYTRKINSILDYSGNLTHVVNNNVSPLG